MAERPAIELPEFGKRQVRPAVRRADPPRPLSSLAPRRIPGAALRSFLEPGAVAHVPPPTPKASRRLSVALTVASGLYLGLALAPYANTASVKQAATAAAQLVIAPAAAMTADLADGVRGQSLRATEVLTEAHAAEAKALAQAVSNAPASFEAAVRSSGSAIATAAGKVAEAAQRAIVEGGRTLSNVAFEAYDGAKASAAAWVKEQIADGISSAKLMKRELTPAMAALSALADHAANNLMDRMDRSERMAEIERTGMVVDPATLPSEAETNARIAADAQALVRDNEQKIASVEPSKIDLSDLSPKASGRHKGFASASAYAYAGYEVAGNTVKIGGEKIDAHVVSSIARAAKVTGNDPVYMASLASRESSFRPKLQETSSSATGLFQFLQQTWFHVLKTFGAQFGYEDAAKEIKVASRGYVVSNPAKRSQILALRADPLAAATMAGAMEKSDRAVIEKVLGRAPTAGERYMTHFFGVAEAARFLSLAKQWPNGPAADYFYKAAMANKTLFWRKDGSKKTFTEVAGGFKDWFEGPDGGMQRFQQFELAAAAVERNGPVRAAARDDVKKPVAEAAPKDHRHVASAKPRSVTPGKVKLDAAAKSKPASAGSSSVAQAPVSPKTQVAAQETKPETVKANSGAETVVYETQYVRTPIVPGKPASYQVTGGDISRYIDSRGFLSKTATIWGRSRLIDGFGPDFERLPAKIQEHLSKAEQFDINLLAPYARLMPKSMRDGLASAGLVFIDATPSTGGKLVAVKVPKHVAQANDQQPAPTDVVQQTTPVNESLPANEAEASAEGAASPIIQAALTSEQPDPDRSMFADVSMPKLPPIPSGAEREFVPKDINAELAAAEKPDLSPFPDSTTSKKHVAGRRLTDDEVRARADALQRPARRQSADHHSHEDVADVSTPRFGF